MVYNTNVDHEHMLVLPGEQVILLCSAWQIFIILMGRMHVIHGAKSICESARGHYSLFSTGYVVQCMADLRHSLMGRI